MPSSSFGHFTRLRAPASAARPTDATRVRLRAAVVATLAVLVLASWSVHDAFQRTTEANRWVEHTQRVLIELGKAREAYASFEASHRGFLLAGMEHHLAERARAAERLRVAIDHVQRLVADNQGQYGSAGILRRLSTQRIAQAEQHAVLRREQGFGAPWSAAAVEAAGATSAEFHRLTAWMEEEELRLLARRQGEEETRQRNVQFVLAASLLAGLLLLVPAYLGYASQARQRTALQRQMADLVQGLPVTVWQIRSSPGGQRRFEFVSESARMHRGLSVDAIRGDIQTVLGSVLDEDRPGLLAAMERAEASLGEFDQRYRILMPDGAVRWIHSSANLRREAAGTVLWSGFWADITASEQLQRELRAANEALEAFSYTVSHDLRAPIAAIDGFSQALAERLPAGGDDRLQHYVRRIRAGTRLASELIDGLLALATLSTTELRWDKVDLTQLAEAVASELQERDDGRSVRWEIERGLVAHGDARLLRQVLANLMGNAWKFSAGRQPAEIRVGTASARGLACFVVADNGAGFDPQYASRLFAPFQRLHSASEFAGHGIGLAAVARILQRHRGEIWAEAAPGVGARFYFTIGRQG